MTKLSETEFERRNYVKQKTEQHRKELVGRIGKTEVKIDRNKFPVGNVVSLNNEMKQEMKQRFEEKDKIISSLEQERDKLKRENNGLKSFQNERMMSAIQSYNTDHKVKITPRSILKRMKGYQPPVKEDYAITLSSANREIKQLKQENKKLKEELNDEIKELNELQLKLGLYKGRGIDLFINSIQKEIEDIILKSRLKK